MSTEYAVPDVTKSSLSGIVNIPPPTVPFHPNIYNDDAPPPPLPPHPYGTFPNIQVGHNDYINLMVNELECTETIFNI